MLANALVFTCEEEVDAVNGVLSYKVYQVSERMHS